MNGRNHVLVGAGAWLLAAPLVAARFGWPVTSAQLAAGTLLTGGAALLPDVDHPRATIARTLGPVTRGLCWAVAEVSGGHRHATHSLLGVAAFAAAAAGLVRWSWGVFTVFLLCGAWALHLLGPDYLRARIPAAVGAAVVAWWAATNLPPEPWMVAAVAGGCLAHLAADLVTRGSIPLLWPLRWRWSLGLLRNGQGAEHFLTLPLTALVLWLAWSRLGIGWNG